MKKALCVFAGVGGRRGGEEGRKKGEEETERGKGEYGGQGTEKVRERKDEVYSVCFVGN